MPDFSYFDNPVTERFNKDRMEFIGPLLHRLRGISRIDSALDVGSGLGDFSDFLVRLGIQHVLGIEGRETNTRESRRRFPALLFETGDVENLRAGLGTFDLVLCFGLVYHLENPFRVIRQLQALTEKFLLLESMCVPGSGLEVLDEVDQDNQGLRSVALYPSEPALVRMLQRSGFPFVYGFPTLPASEWYAASLWRKRMRTMLLAAKIELRDVPQVRLLPDSPRVVLRDVNPWATPFAHVRHALSRLRFHVGSALKSLRS